MSAYNITLDNFKEEVLESNIPVLLDFWASWCGTCRYVSTMVEEISAEITYAKVGKVNVAEQQELAIKYNVTNIPTLLIIKNGRVEYKFDKAKPKSHIKEALTI